MTDPTPRDVLHRVLMSDDLFTQLGAGRVDWGEPDRDGFYTPTVYTRQPDGALDAFWLAFDTLVGTDPQKGYSRERQRGWDEAVASIRTLRRLAEDADRGA